MQHYAICSAECTVEVFKLCHYGHICLMQGISFSLVDIVLFMLARHSFYTIRKHASSFLAYRKAARWVVRNTLRQLPLGNRN